MSNINEDTTVEFNIGNMAPVVGITGGEDGILSKDKVVSLPDNTKFDEEEPDDEQFKEGSFDDIDSFSKYFTGGEYMESTASLVGYLSTVGVVTTVALGMQLGNGAKVKQALKIYTEHNKIKYPYGKVIFKAFKMNAFNKNNGEKKELNPIEKFFHTHSKNTTCYILFPDKSHTKEKDQLLRIFVGGDANDKCEIEFINPECKSHKDYYSAIVALKIKRELGNVAIWAEDIKKQYAPETKTSKKMKAIKESFDALDINPEPLTPIDLSNTEFIDDAEDLPKVNPKAGEIKVKKVNNYKEMQQALKTGNMEKLNDLINARRCLNKEDIDCEPVTEARGISNEIMDVVATLNNKGYKVKYSSPGYPSERRKEDIYKDGVLNGKLYTSARLVFKKDYKFKDVPKGWELKVMDNNAVGLYVKNPTYKITDGLPKDAFYNWKTKYMANLRSWADKLEPVTSDGEEPVKKESTYTVEDVFEDLLIDSF